jgi:hypothetical protein
MGRSTNYYRKNKAARKRKAATDKKINARPAQKAKRRELERKRVAAKKRGVNTSKTDYDHAVGKRVPKSINRGRKGEGGRKRKRRVTKKK